MAKKPVKKYNLEYTNTRQKALSANKLSPYVGEKIKEVLS